MRRVRGSSVMSGEEMHNSSEVRMALLQHQQATLELPFGLHA